MKKQYKYLLFIFPVIYLLLGFYFRQVFGDLSLRSTDPEYIDFISGMCVATGKFSQANIDHPGSIFQIILAVVFRIIYFFRGNGTPFFEDAIANSDLYLAVSNLVITTIIASVMLWAGKATLKITNNYLYALLIQVAPLIINVWYDIIGRIYPELILVIPVYLLQVQLLREIFNKNDNPTKSLATYSFAVGIGLSIKMTFLPFIVLPLFVIKKLSRKIKYLLYSIAIFFLLSPQVAFQWHHFWNWMKGMFIHSGRYQAGSSNIIDVSLFLKNLGKILTDERYFFYAAAILIILLLILIFTKRAKSPFSLISMGLTLTFAGLVFIVSKQFAIRYFLPAILFFPFLLILNKEIIQVYFKQKAVKTGLSIILIFIIGYNINQTIPYARIVSKSISKQMSARIQTRDFINTLPKNSYKIIVSQDYGCPFHEYAIMYSFAMGGKQWPNYREKLNKLYPDTYMYFTWDNTIKYWGKPYNPLNIANSDKPVYLYLQKNNDELYKRTIDKLLENSKDISIKKKLLFNNPVNHEGILQLYFSTNPIPVDDTIKKTAS